MIGNFASFTRLSPYLKDMKHVIIIALVASVLASLAEGFGVGMIVPLLQGLFNQERSDGTDPISHFFSNYLSVQNSTLRLGLTCLVILAAIALKNVFLYTSTTQMARIRESLILRLRQAMFIQLQMVGLSFFTEHRVGDLIQTQFGELERAKQGFDFFLQMLSKLLTASVFVLFLLFLSPLLTLLTLIILGLTVCLVDFLHRTIQQKGERMTEYSSQLSSNTLEALNGIQLIKTSASESREIKRFKSLSMQLLRQVYGFEQRVHLITPISETLGIAAALGIIFFSYTFLVSRNLLSAAALLTFVVILLRLLPLGIEANFLRGQIAFSSAAFDRVMHLLNPADKPFIKNGRRRFTGLQHSIRLRDVDFGYNPEEPVLKNVSFEIPKGKTVAFVGGSGSGKSTITKLLLRFYDVNRGQIEIDGIDLRDYNLDSLRKRIAIVSQETFLFNCSVRDNLAYGLDQVTEAEIVEAAKGANAHDFISELPEGYDTPLGDRGVRLSGGQRQRLSIARALLRNPDVLILDEATSNLDPESEKLVQDAIEQLCKNRTTIMIAHRFSTIENADKLIVLDHGRVEEEGTWDELIQKQGLFWKLYNLQCVAVPATVQ
ncbi:MAG: ABC transporter ATP-binding protein [Leptolyngbyaceae cyanobacterium bins.302]|nr:ABC transporter ATP-binding protein [Leptolyngbyaceae cyanobacterium bins.302]